MLERLVGLGAVVLLGLSACGEQSNVDPNASVAVHGSFRAVDGTPLEARPVRLGSGVSLAEGGLGFLTVGLSCIGGGCSGTSFDTTTDATGSYRFDLTGRETQSSFGEAESFLVSTSAPAAGRRPTGPAISARFRIQTTTVELPPLALVDVRPELAATDDGAVAARWDGSVAPAPYTITYRTPTGDPVWEMATAEPTAVVDGRVLEDVTGLASVSTTQTDAIEGSDLDIVTQSSGIAFRGGFGPPPSRLAACEVRSDGGSSQPVDPCPLTDARFRPAALPTAVCPGAGEASTGCEAAASVRVQLDDPVPADLVVVRGCREACRVAVVHDDGTVGDAGAVSNPYGLVQLDGSRLRAVDVVTADVSTLTEVSVWAPVADTPPLLDVDDPAHLLTGASGGDRGSNRLVVAAAIASLLLAGLGVGIAVGRRSRRPHAASTDG